ncbi:uncharacterized protein LOC115484817 [Serinus canaria]|uniref:uncharacterized protein LOC115484817 n=1 Tax=Serinus canaria TaxID=9135 RepID=UPI0021CCA149|nr:uncharacterized protein LOC115484817 [Serinus canaria]
MSSGHWEVHIPSWKGTACKWDGSWGSPNTGPSLRAQKAHSESQLGDNALIQRFPTPVPLSCVGYALYRVKLMLTSHRSCAPTALALSTPVLPPAHHLGACHPWRGLTALSQEGRDGPNLLVPKGEVPSSLGTKSHHLPPSGLRKSWSHQLPTPATPSERGLWGQGVFGHFSFCLEVISFLLSIPEPGACCQTGVLFPAPASPFSLLPPGFSLLQHPPSPCFLQASPCSNTLLLPCTMLTLTRAPHLCPHDWMLESQLGCALPDVQTHPAGPILCSGARFGCTGVGKGGGEVGEGEGRMRCLPL